MLGGSGGAEGVGVDPAVQLGGLGGVFDTATAGVYRDRDLVVVLEKRREDIARILDRRRLPFRRVTDLDADALLVMARDAEIFGAEETIDAAIDDPLGFLDYLIPDGSGNIAFDDGYVREQPGPTTS